MTARPTRRLAVVVAVAALLLSAPATAAAPWRSWRDPGFGAAIQYPAELFRPDPAAQHEAEGLTLAGPGGARLVVYSGNNVAGQAPATYLAWLRDAEAQQAQWARTQAEPLTPGLAGPGYVTRSGTRGGRLVYEKHLFSPGGATIHVLHLDYPLSEKAVIEPLIPRLAASLHHAP